MIFLSNYNSHKSCQKSCQNIDPKYWMKLLLQSDDEITIGSNVLYSEIFICFLVVQKLLIFYVWHEAWYQIQSKLKIENALNLYTKI